MPDFVRDAQATRDTLLADASHDAQGNEVWFDGKWQRPPDAQGSVAREREPKTEAGRALDSATYHGAKCDKSALMDGPCTCGWTPLILAIEAEAAAMMGQAVNRARDYQEAEAVKPWREALAELLRHRPAYNRVDPRDAPFEKARALLDEANNE